MSKQTPPSESVHRIPGGFNSPPPLGTQKQTQTSFELLTSERKLQNTVDGSLNPKANHLLDVYTTMYK